VLLGVSLSPSWNPADSAGDFGWPNTRTSATSIDHDADGLSGVTTHAVPPGGVNADEEFYPNSDYPSVATFCSPDRPFNYWPVDPFLGVDGCDDPFGDPCRITTFAVGSRTVSAYDGDFTTSCDRITGNVIGPNPDGPDTGTDGDIRIDARVFDCKLTGGDCDPLIINWLDQQTQSQVVGNNTFVIKRVPAGLLTDGLTCAEVRGMDFN
jgi:hypothetical protein